MKVNQVRKSKEAKPRRNVPSKQNSAMTGDESTNPQAMQKLPRQLPEESCPVFETARRQRPTYRLKAATQLLLSIRVLALKHNESRALIGNDDAEERAVTLLELLKTLYLGQVEICLLPMAPEGGGCFGRRQNWVTQREQLDERNSQNDHVN